jgi:hypothetical protein
MRVWSSIALTFFMGLSVHADLWTNVAGYAIEAELVGGDGRRVQLERPNGEQISVSLMSLSAESRQAATDQLQKQNPENQNIDAANAIAERTRALNAAGQISDAELQATLDSLPGQHAAVLPMTSVNRDTLATAQQLCHMMRITGRWFSILK